MPQLIAIETGDGTCRAELHAPPLPSTTGVILYMDAFGWTIPDLAIHDPAGAARHWKRLFTVLEEMLVEV